MTTMDELGEAYRRTLYAVDGRFTLRVGEHSPEADALLGRQETWAFVTACNPRSRRLSADENAARMAELRDAIAAHVPHTAEGRSPEGDWAEASFFVAGLSEADATALALRFGQLAYVFGERGRPARLVWTGLTPHADRGP